MSDTPEDAQIEGAADLLAVSLMLSEEGRLTGNSATLQAAAGFAIAGSIMAGVELLESIFDVVRAEIEAERAKPNG